MTIRIDNKIADEVFWDKPIWREIIIDLPDLFANLRLLKLEIYVNRTWIPNKFNINSNDNRNLGMVIEKIELT
jgi:hypothetical protein